MPEINLLTIIVDFSTYDFHIKFTASNMAFCAKVDARLSLSLEGKIYNMLLTSRRAHTTILTNNVDIKRFIEVASLQRGDGLWRSAVCHLLG